MPRERPAVTIWRFFPWWVAAGMGVAIVVNTGMIYGALHSYPGLAAAGGFDLSNRYNQVIARSEEQAALGWDARATVGVSGEPAVAIAGRTGAALTGAIVRAVAERPLGDPETVTLQFAETSPGQYIGGTALTHGGQWALHLTVTHGGRTMNVTRRVVVP